MGKGLQRAWGAIASAASTVVPGPDSSIGDMIPYLAAGSLRCARFGHDGEDTITCGEGEKEIDVCDGMCWLDGGGERQASVRPSSIEVIIVLSLGHPSENNDPPPLVRTIIPPFLPLPSCWHHFSPSQPDTLSSRYPSGSLPGPEPRGVLFNRTSRAAMLTASRRSLLRRARDLLFTRWGLLDWLRLLWCALVCWYEFASFHYALSSCTWPDGPLPASPDKPVHVLLVADPQVRDLSTSRRIGFSTLRQYTLDLALKRHWHFASRTHPDVVIFLGDILASWRLIRTDEEYERNLRKFREIFQLHPGVMSYYVPGNNDVGLNIEPSAAREARSRFTTHFGPLNQKVALRNHTLVMLDAAGLVEEDYLRAAKYIDYEHWKPLPHGTVEFVHSLQKDSQVHSMVLFTHIPLHRPDTASCGPLREKGTIHRGVGPGYQNTLGKKTTTFLLQALRPSMVYRFVTNGCFLPRIE
ncbi:hypothetical protein NUW54_g12301 [Trametes sanguinea]|uniref:Uncharacterized protein n=1 Tax=Trametes sanguinea TaxID=158606 RepID=A0ACC1MZL9_9APHY|nr:hypothetical protein NUW54_g12301 [Trametes sanguinea]